MIDLSEVSIISHLRLENKDRLDNLILRNKIMKSLSINSQFIIVEDDTTPKLPNNILDGDDIYHFIENNGSYTKNIAYNKGAELSTRPYMVFLDVDCILHPKLLTGLITHESQLFNGLVFPYNRFALYMTPFSKRLLNANPTYDTLTGFIPPAKLSHGIRSKLGHLFGNCPGGSYMMNQDFFHKVNGFNPNFKGWGYEDTAFLTTIQRLGITVNKVGGSANMMFHLHHGDVNNGEVFARGKHLDTIATQHNKRICDEIEGMTKPEAEEYIKSWTL